MAAAQDDLSRARDREVAQLQGVIATYQGYADRLRDYSRALEAQARGALDPADSLEQVRAAFQRTAGLAAQNDNQALDALEGVSESFLEAERANAKDRVSLLRAQLQVKAAVDDAAEASQSTADSARAQLDAQNRTVDAVLGVRTAVESVSEGLAALAAAIQQQAAVNAHALAAAQAGPRPLSSFDAATYGGNNPDLVAEYARYAVGASAYQQFYALGLSLDEYLQAHFDMTGREEIEKGLRGFAGGGSFLVGGFGGTDSQHVEFMATPGERVTISRPDQWGAANDPVMMAILRNTGDAARVLRRWDGDGQPPVREEAA